MPELEPLHRDIETEKLELIVTQAIEPGAVEPVQPKGQAGLPAEDSVLDEAKSQSPGSERPWAPES
jgi:hypothetical protein